MKPGRKKQTRPIPHRERPRPSTDQASTEIERLQEENERLRKQLAEQAKRIADLERQLALKHQNSTLTSKPPSSDGLAGQPREPGRQRRSRRKAGGQPGHPGHHRALVPLERVQAMVDLTPDACRRCAHPLTARHTAGDPRRHQVTELPPIEPHVTEYRCHRRQCPACGTTTLAPLPDDLAGQFGPQLTALIAYLTVVCRLPRLVVQRLLEGVLQVPMSLGSTQKAWEEASAAVATPYAELQHALAQQPVLHSDETGHRTNGAKRWLWTLVAPSFIFYTIATSRGSDVLRGLLGATFAGVLATDRLPMYLSYAVDRRQFCWSHFRRNLLSAQAIAAMPAGRRFCQEALACQRQLFRLWHRYRGDAHTRGSPLSRAQLIAKVQPLERRLFALAERHVNAVDADVSNLARALFVHHSHFFTFVHVEGVAPTNNCAERALRTAVQWRKIMFGNRSAEGELAVARLLTVASTCQHQQRNVLAYLSMAVACYRRRDAVASLRPDA